MNPVFAVSGVLLVQLVTMPILSYAQVGRGRPQRTGQGAGTSLPKAVPDVTLPSFDGKVRGIDEKLLTLERPDSNTMEFHCSKKTHYFDGTKKVKADAVKTGDSVSVEAKRAPDGSLDAVNVRIQRPKSS
jgi:hypothetical protein